MGTRRLVLAALVGLLLGALSAAPALAEERDPFVPLISEESADEAPANEPQEEQATQPDAQPAAPTGSEGLPTTGADVFPFVGAAYVLIAIGAASLVLTRINSTDRA